MPTVKAYAFEPWPLPGISDGRLSRYSVTNDGSRIHILEAWSLLGISSGRSFRLNKTCPGSSGHLVFATSSVLYGSHERLSTTSSASDGGGGRISPAWSAANTQSDLVGLLVEVATVYVVAYEESKPTSSVTSWSFPSMEETGVFFTALLTDQTDTDGFRFPVDHGAAASIVASSD